MFKFFDVCLALDVYFLKCRVFLCFLATKNQVQDPNLTWIDLAVTAIFDRKGSSNFRSNSKKICSKGRCRKNLRIVTKIEERKPRLEGKDDKNTNLTAPPLIQIAQVAPAGVVRVVALAAAVAGGCWVVERVRPGKF